MSYVRNAWYVAGWSKDLTVGKPLAVTILNERLVVWRGASGSLYALEDRCAHRLAPLSRGRCEGDGVRCMYHGLLFAGDGSLIEIPGQDLIPAGAGVRSFAIADRHGWIWIWMGARAAADLELIPPAIGVDREDYILGHGHLDYDAEARLISENLLDFSHLAFVHANSFGEDPSFAGVPARISSLERGVRYERWIENTVGSAYRQTAEPTDTFLTYDYLLPGVLILQGGVFPLGTARRCNLGMPDFSQAMSDVTATSQAVTPVTDKTARYFYAWGPRCDHGDESYRDALMGVAGQAFQEDKLMIEAQQAVIDATDKVKIMPTVHDRGITLYNRLVERLSKAEKRDNVSVA